MVACADDSLSSRRNDWPICANEEDEDPSTILTSDVAPIVAANFTTLDQEAWPSAAGYTPLGEIHSMGSIFVAMPPDYEGENGGNNSFVADPSALFGGFTATVDQGNGIGDVVQDDEQSQIETSRTETETGDFRDIASTALMALEDDYLMTVRGEVRPSLMDAQPRDAGPFMPMLDTGCFHSHANEDCSGFADFESVIARDNMQNPSFNTRSIDEKLKKFPEINVAAVQKAVAGIKDNSDVMSEKLQQWERARQKEEEQKRLQSKHGIIPAAPLKAFRKSTPKAVQATANLTRAATIADCLDRISVLLKSQHLLRIHVVGADHVECSSSQRIQSLFGPLTRWIGGNIYSPRHLHISLVGPNMPTIMAESGPVNILVSSSNKNGRRESHQLESAKATCHEAKYHEWLQRQQVEQTDNMPDLIVCFNAGIWGYDDWRPTLHYLVDANLGVPLIVTSYTIQEAEDDYDVLEEVVQAQKCVQCTTKCLWKPQENIFASKQKRETATAVEGREYRENMAWQAWRL